MVSWASSSMYVIAEGSLHRPSNSSKPMPPGPIGPGVLKGPIRRDLSNSVYQIQLIDRKVARELFQGSLTGSAAPTNFQLKLDDQQEEVFSYQKGVLTVNPEMYKEQVGDHGFYQQLTRAVRRGWSTPAPTP